ncbi:Ppx/GppA phosphatase family protein [Hydrogenimonas cancrithermarum]|uniref:Exopolyphosphatase n=1 Tax=Hydrogenimonas cancrithermarum TaxID=2993563 RepID=A0ABN6WSU0_9BACT|nr:phosphatase [Hydrogenimonas cancrithermarum]BDY12200.1 exopolyphosphatase [Hydrogenimonas cancrithermarum]
MIAIDLGSNTFRAVEMACETLEPVRMYEKIVKTADRLHETGEISDAALERIVSAAEEAKMRLDFSQKVVAVTTEAIRKASNADDVIAAIARRTGISFRVISGEEEAKYTLLAVKSRLEKSGFESDAFVMVDIGGGSTEIVFYQAGKVSIESFPVGIVTVAQAYDSLEAIEAALPALMEPMAEHAARAKASGYHPKRFVPTAGTPTTVAAMKLGMDYATYDPKRINGARLLREELKTQLCRLLALDEKARQMLVGVGREDLIAAGILIFDHLYEILGFDEAVVIDDGLREGVAIAECRQLNIHEIFD